MRFCFQQMNFDVKHHRNRKTVSTKLPDFQNKNKEPILMKIYIIIADSCRITILKDY